MDISNEELDILVGEKNGWVRYPSDSVECGRVWHCDKDRAPFGRIIDVCDYNPSVNTHYAMEILEKEKINLSWCQGESLWKAWNVTDKLCLADGFADTIERAICLCYIKTKGD